MRVSVLRVGVALVIAASGLSVACAPKAEPEKAEPPTLDVTSWTDKTELFMEYPPLVAGRRCGSRCT